MLRLLGHTHQQLVFQKVLSVKLIVSYDAIFCCDSIFYDQFYTDDTSKLDDVLPITSLCYYEITNIKYCIYLSIS